MRFTVWLRESPSHAPSLQEFRWHWESETSAQFESLVKRPWRIFGLIVSLERRKAGQSHVEVGHRQGVLLDELAARFDLVTHQGGEDVIRGDSILDLDLHEAPGFRVDRGLPQLLRIHLTQALVALDGLTLARLVEQPLRSEERRVGKECRSRWSPY